MDANRIQDQSKELVDKLLSADPADVSDAVNQYFKVDATLLTSTVHVEGADKIKKLAKMNAWTRIKSGSIIDTPKYDQKSKTIRYASTITYTSPQLPTYIPLSAQFSGYETKSDWDFVAHLTSSEGGKKMYVGKLEAKRRGSTIIDAVPPFILRPVATFLALAIVAIITFVQTHKGDGVAGFILAGLTEVVNTMWGFIAPEIGKRQEQAEKWREEKGPLINTYIQNASSTAQEIATYIRSDLETRAKSAGIPVDDYVSRASAAISDLADNLEARAKTAGIPVEDYKQQAEAAIEELKRRAGNVGEFLEGKAGEAKKTAEQAGEKAQEMGNEAEKRTGEVGKEVKRKVGEGKRVAGKKVGEAKEGAEGVAQDAQKKANSATNTAKQATQQPNASAFNANKPTQDAPTLAPVVVSTGEKAGHLNSSDAAAKEIRAEFEATPHTPLGGHDPTAPNAPSFTEAAKI